ncbi:FadR/GntR family transcriptional regulator [Acrocarpospora catenulata]|uniref:FadR/GntR family transcriptional regulator n=1 Tax=Acrocarpospora catenulata TaxID=2836182 RepID=UPI001BDAF053|nr:FCD domain-containing protein [Acrocarpospora catenulata]
MGSDPDPGRQAVGTLPQMTQPAIAEMVADEIRNRIISGELPEGSLLPRQEEMMRELNVSRPSYREALRILEAERLVSVRRGNQGGAVVHAPSQVGTTYSLGLLLRYQQVSLGDLADAISEIEPLCAGVAASRPDRQTEVVPQLGELVDRQERALGLAHQFTLIGREFHESIVRLCGNATLTLTAGALAGLWSTQELEWADVVAVTAGYPAPEQQRRVLQTHRLLVAAIAAGDRHQATTLMRAHSLASHHHVLAERRHLPVTHLTQAKAAGRPAG